MKKKRKDINGSFVELVCCSTDKQAQNVSIQGSLLVVKTKYGRLGRQAQKKIQTTYLLKMTPTTGMDGEESTRVVVNLSKQKISETEEQVLSLGMNFAPTPKEIPVDDIIVGTEALVRHLDLATATELRQLMKVCMTDAKPPKPNFEKKGELTIQIRKRLSLAHSHACAATLWSPKSSQRGDSPLPHCLDNWHTLLQLGQGTS